MSPGVPPRQRIDSWVLFRLGGRPTSSVNQQQLWRGCTNPTRRSTTSLRREWGCYFLYMLHDTFTVYKKYQYLLMCLEKRRYCFLLNEKGKTWTVATDVFDRRTVTLQDLLPGPLLTGRTASICHRQAAAPLTSHHEKKWR